METVKLGDHSLIVAPQRHARLRHQLSPSDFTAIMSQDYSVNAYRVLGILIPTLPTTIPLWEWEGFGSEEAMKAGTYVEEDDKSPFTDEIINAFEQAFLVSGAGRMGKIIDLIQTGVAAQGMADTTQTATPTSPDSPGASGESH